MRCRAGAPEDAAPPRGAGRDQPSARRTSRDERLRAGRSPDEWEVNAGVLHELGSRFALLTTLEQGVLARLMEGSIVHDIVSERLMAPAVIHSLVHSILQKLQVVTWLDAV